MERRDDGGDIGADAAVLTELHVRVSLCYFFTSRLNYQ